MQNSGTAFNADLYTTSFTFLKVGTTVIRARSIRPVCPGDIPGCLVDGWPNFLTQNPGSHIPMAVVLLGSLNISVVLYSTMQDEPLSYCTYQKSQGKPSSVTACINVL